MYISVLGLVDSMMTALTTDIYSRRISMHLAILKFSAHLDRSLEASCVYRSIQPVCTAVCYSDGLSIIVNDIDTGARSKSLLVNNSEMVWRCLGVNKY